MLSADDTRKQRVYWFHSSFYTVLLSGYLQYASEVIPEEPFENVNSSAKTAGKNWPSLMRNHICAFCGKGFNRKLLLEYHQRVHTGECPFQCSICLRGFSHKGAMQRHMFTHIKSDLK